MLKYPKFREKFEKVRKIKIEGRLNKKLKSIRYYLVHEEYGEAFNQFRKFDKLLQEIV